MKPLGIKIKDLRESLNMTQQELADKIGISQPYVNQIESGKANPSLKTLNKIAEVLNADPSYFFTTSPISDFKEHLTPKEREYVEKNKPVITYLAGHELTISEVKEALNIYMTYKQLKK